jgi:hypothetical protein
LQPRNVAKIAQVPRDQNRLVGERDAGNQEVRPANALQPSRLLESSEDRQGRFIERYDEELGQPLLGAQAEGLCPQ